MTAAAQPTPALHRHGPVSQLRAQAPHSMQASRSGIAASPFVMTKTACGQTSHSCRSRCTARRRARGSPRRGGTDPAHLTPPGTAIRPRARARSPRRRSGAAPRPASPAAPPTGRCRSSTPVKFMARKPATAVPNSSHAAGLSQPGGRRECRPPARARAQRRASPRPTAPLSAERAPRQPGQEQRGQQPPADTAGEQRDAAASPVVQHAAQNPSPPSPPSRITARRHRQQQLRPPAPARPGSARPVRATGNRTAASRGSPAARGEKRGQVLGPHRPPDDSKPRSPLHLVRGHPGGAELGHDQLAVLDHLLEAQAGDPRASSSVPKVPLPAAHQTLTPSVSSTRIQASRPAAARAAGRSSACSWRRPARVTAVRRAEGVEPRNDAVVHPADAPADLDGAPSGRHPSTTCRFGARAPPVCRVRR